MKGGYDARFGAGLFGGNGGGDVNNGKGGTSYIGSSNLISFNNITKHMTCYNCSTSTDVNTYTQSNTCANSGAVADCSKAGHGYARITRLN